MRSSEIEDRLTHKFHFAVKRKTGHVHYELRLEGLPPIRTHVSHSHASHGDVSRDLLALMAREMRVQPSYLRGMLDCTIGCDTYWAKLREDL